MPAPLRIPLVGSPHVVTSKDDLTGQGVEWLVSASGGLLDIYINGVRA